jgi:hypothetical protein
VKRAVGDKYSSKQMFIYAHHGFGGGRKSGGKVNRLEDAAISFPDCQIYLMGHVHDKAAWIKPALHVAEQTDKVIQKFRAFGITGTFKKTYQQDAMGYGEKMMYPSTALGVISFSIRPFSDSGQIEIGAFNSTTGLPA